MTNTDKKKFAELMATMQEVFTPEKPISTAKMEIYFKILEPYNIEDITSAFVRVIHTKEYPTFPLPADIIKALTEPEDLDAKAEEAWILANKHLSLMCINERCGEDVSGHPLTETVKKAFGGWEKLGFCNPYDDVTDRKRFIEAYKNTAKKETERRLLDGKKPRQLL